MEEHEKIRAALADEHITEVGFLPRKSFCVLAPGMMKKCDDVRSAIVFLIPYRTGAVPKDGLNISLYARVKDYHAFFSTLSERITSGLESIFPGERFYGFCDRSPIDEKAAAASCGLGVTGMNTLLISPVYGSFVFIGSFLTTLELVGENERPETRRCAGCGRCASSCPAGAISEHGIDRERCLSAVSQKKAKTPEDERVLVETGTVWGCDICQLVCPMNASAKLTGIPYFTESFDGDLSAEKIEAMDDREFEQYAFSWRGRKVITDNIRRIRGTRDV